jgi:hypothetical protein
VLAVGWAPSTNAQQHDLEGDEFDSDAANLAAWQEAFQQHHYWALPLGPVLAIGLSTVRFRSNAHRCAVCWRPRSLH